MANPCMVLERSDTHSPSLAEDGSRTTADRTCTARFSKSGECGYQGSASSSLSQACGDRGCPATRYSSRTVRVESRNQTGAAWSLRENSASPQTDANCRDRFSSSQSARDG